jgi:hypothetical protein
MSKIVIAFLIVTAREQRVVILASVVMELPQSKLNENWFFYCVSRCKFVSDHIKHFKSLVDPYQVSFKLRLDEKS